MANSTIYENGVPKGTQTDYSDYATPYKKPLDRFHQTMPQEGKELYLSPEMKEQFSHFKGNEKVFSSEETKKIIKD